ncbi:UDP-N-acetylglucosamine 2-epimerase [Salinimicrobium sp. HB62]|uniref:UDP-N-acetylglucosamine 2-epimerase n=1 Tax=Salinimicrobium sp. HB62 TaxID=3077781 RepID=UPI002D76AE30|nr:UDP-N-acetylglucosamine 2-epimerase [Salinimicrobium sp. HB62]
MNIGVLTSSRADFGIYLPLIRRLKAEKGITYTIISFGTHLSKFHGYTVNEILENDLKVEYMLPTLLASETEEGISTSAALCSMKFSSFWASHKDEFDVVLCLGDRYEMFAAVSAGVPFGIRFAHLYGGDRSLGVIDNMYRDSLTHFSSLHFTSTNSCAERVKQLKFGKEPVEVVGLLSLDDIEEVQLPSLEEFEEKWQIDLSLPTILATIHPETISPEKNHRHSQELVDAFLVLSKTHQIVITMPNADTEGFVYRESFEKLKKLAPEKIFLIEHFGRTSYFSCMKYSHLLIGNSSSGISEAASFNRYAINVGDRQKGRETGPNTFHARFDATEIVKIAEEILKYPFYKGENIYRRKGGVEKIVTTLKSEIDKRIVNNLLE